MADKVPTEAFVVRTLYSRYCFGEADKNGARTVSRDNNPLEFTRCTLERIAVVGRGLTLNCHDGPYPHWYTSTIVAIDPVH